ncbi:MAG: diphthamide biosynthesis enzyme Dph2 [Thermofilaceae archaeon]|nr:diphthamide biosynthesis enzyme Dph2 [Thermofilaceae archaeon]MCX8180586.1 diphthamide biosynthesis enzyme Dph2 [Thermofilaceae archaeon]MDW8003688.1 diphthamide biosynthesis enzyme Dph2 [Thermofilaceae archaeon]
MRSYYDLEEKRIIRWAQLASYRRLLIQAPDGMKTCARRLAELLTENGFEPFLSSSHAWGGCDVALNELDALGLDALVHLGHHGPVRFSPSTNVLFVPGYSTVNVLRGVEKALAKLTDEDVRRVGLVTTIQHLNQLPRIKAFLAENGFEVLTSKSPSPRMSEGLVIGCDVRAAEIVASKVDAFLVVAGGTFHALGVALANGCSKTIAVDPYLEKVSDMGNEVKSVLSRRLAQLADALDSREAAVIVSTKPGQRIGWDKLKGLEETLRRYDIKTQFLVFNDVTREALENYGWFDLYINTACPRLAIDDPHLFPGPVVNAEEFLSVLRKGLQNYEPGLALRSCFSNLS